MKYRFISAQRSAHRVEMMARVLGVTRSGYYAWEHSGPSAHEVEDKALVESIEAIQKKMKHRYGSPRMTRELQRSGWQVGQNRVARLMREKGLGARPRKAFRVTIKSNHGLAVAPNLLRRHFAVPAATKVWVPDISYVDQRHGVGGEHGGFLASSAHAAFDVAHRLFGREGIDADGDSDGACQGLQDRQTEAAAEGFVAAEDDGESVEGVQVEVGQEADLGQDVIGQQVRFVKQKDRMRHPMGVPAVGRFGARKGPSSSC